MEHSCRCLAPGWGAVTFTHDLDVSPCSSFRLELVHVNLNGRFNVPHMIKRRTEQSVSRWRQEHYFTICVLQLSPGNKLNRNGYVQIWRTKLDELFRPGMTGIYYLMFLLHILCNPSVISRVRMVAKSVCCLRHVSPSVRPSVCPRVSLRLPLDGFM